MLECIPHENVGAVLGIVGRLSPDLQQAKPTWHRPCGKTRELVQILLSR